MYDETKERKSGTRVILLVILCIAFLIAILWKQGLIHWEQSPEEQNEQIATVEKESTITPNSGFMVSESDWETLQNEVKQLRKEVEQLKAANQIEWVRRMNSIQNRAEEIVLHELVYAEEAQYANT